MRVPITVIVGIGIALSSTASATATQTPTEPPACLDFASQQEAQDFYESEGGPSRDSLGLDPNRDGRACDNETAIGRQTPTSTATSPTTTATSSGLRTGVIVAIILAAGVLGLALYYLWRQRLAAAAAPAEPD